VSAAARALIMLMLLAWSAAAGATLAGYDFKDEAEERRFKDLLGELRCLVCQNQSLADSAAGLADDLRRETYKLMKAGHSDEEVVQFLVDRYGDFVRYRPPLKASTVALWFGPLILFLLGAFWVYRSVHNRRAVAEPALSEAQRRQLQQLLDGDRQ